jgi:hypothetical protein
MSNGQQLPLFTSDVTQEVQIRMLSGGEQARIPSVTVMENFNRTVTEFGNEPALHQKVIVKVCFCWVLAVDLS